MMDRQNDAYFGYLRLNNFEDLSTLLRIVLDSFKEKID
jgi:hypothetical protein